MDNHNKYLSPFSWRYGSDGMRQVWGEVNKRRLWRQIWVSLAEVQMEYGLVQSYQVADLIDKVDQVDIPRALEIEDQIHHDLMAELKTFAEQSPKGGAILHLGATSADIEDNADALRMAQALDLILARLHAALLHLADKIDQWDQVPLMGFTHLQPAEPTTLGYRLSVCAQDLLMGWEELKQQRRNLRGKGFKGAVGTGASYAELIGADKLDEFEARLSDKLDLEFFPVTTQVYPRLQDYRILNALAGLGASLYKLAFDIRLLQSPPVGELSEPFGVQQVGSSAMPFKRNPINAEKIDSLARSLAQLPRLAWDNAAHSLLERTLDDSANRRSMLPESFLIADELLITTSRIIGGLVVNDDAILRNMAIYGPFASTERVLMSLSKAGADRQVMHERLRELAMIAWQDVETGGENPLISLVAGEPQFLEFLSKDHLESLMDAGQYLGNATERALKMSQSIRDAIN